MGLLEGPASASLRRFGAGGWRVDGKGGLKQAWGVTGSCRSGSSFWGSEVTLEKPQRPACLEALGDLEQAPVVAWGTFLLQQVQEARDAASTLPLAWCTEQRAPEFMQPLNTASHCLSFP